MINQTLTKLLPYIATVFFMMFIYSCQPKVESILHPEKQVTREGLQLELDIIEAQIAARTADIERQEQLREVIFNNALLLAQGATLNPAGILTALAGIYGVGAAGRDIKRKISNTKKANNNNVS